MENFFESKTESRNTNSTNLDTMTSLEIVRLMNEEDKSVASCVGKSLEDIARLIEETSKALKNSGRLIYIGAGTSGRLGVLDASECPPTFSVGYEKVLGLIAGGNSAMFKAVENSEDSELDVVNDLKKIGLNKNDILVGITASGRTPYVISGIKYAKSLGVKTGSIACNKDAKVSKVANFPIEVEVGAEVLTGSTRLKAGTVDYRVENPSDRKLKKTGNNLKLELIENSDIVKYFASKKKNQKIIGFAAETDELIKNAKAKLEKKKLDYIIANDLTKWGAGFNVDTNIASIISKDNIEDLGIMPKDELANKILDLLR